MCIARIAMTASATALRPRNVRPAMQPHTSASPLSTVPQPAPPPATVPAAWPGSTPRGSYDLPTLLETMVEHGVVCAEQASAALARHGVQRARLVKEKSGRGHITHRQNTDVTPTELLASFMFQAVGTDELVDEDRITMTLAQQVAMPYHKIDLLRLDGAFITRTFSRPFARKNVVLPLFRSPAGLAVAIHNPYDRGLLEMLRTLAGTEVLPHLASPTDIQRAIAEVYGFRLSIRDATQKLRGAQTDISNLEQFVHLSSLDHLDAHSEPVVAAVEYLLHYAIGQRVSDIHVEPRRGDATVRMRIDGVLHPVYQLPRVVYAALANRLKILSRLDITSRKPQDGRMRASRGEAEMDIRVSTVPTAFGDKVVLRILDPGALLTTLGDVGLLADEKETLERWIERPHGMVVVTGPTGSGKTTTLYAALQRLASPDVNITTIEDPIEFIHAGFNQIQADTKTGTGFADALRHVLRQDPDIIMLGEVRDAQTAMQAVQAALTGHLVFTTLHTNDTVGAITRLRNLGVADHLIGDTLVGVAAQRLVRRVCGACAVDTVLTVDQLMDLGIKHPDDYAGQLLGRRGNGCPRCRDTGYYGRTGIFEMLPMSRRLRQQVADGAPPDTLWRTARQDGLCTLREHAIRKAALGQTTLEEALAVTADAGGL